MPVLLHLSVEPQPGLRMLINLNKKLLYNIPRNASEVYE
jgi:hypothetical protein